MVKQEGRDHEEITTRRDGMTTDSEEITARRQQLRDAEGATAHRAPRTGLPGGQAGVDTESVDYDDMGDLDRGADDATNAERSTGPGPTYGMMGGPGRVTSDQPEVSGVGNTGSPVRQADLGRQDGSGTGNWTADPAVPNDAVIIDSGDLNEGETEGGPGRGTAPALRISTDAEDSVAPIAGDRGISQGTDMDTTASTAARRDRPTGPPRRAGLGGTSSGSETDFDPAAGSGMANPADMGDQG